MQLEDLKDRVKLIDYVEQNGARLEKAGQNAYRINPCPICGHKDHFTVYPDSNSYTSFSGCCQGGSIIDYMIEVEGLSQNEAISKLKKMAGDTSENLSTRSKPTLVVKEPEVKKLSEGEKKNTSQAILKAAA